MVKNFKANWDTTIFLFKNGRGTVLFLLVFNIIMGFAPLLLILTTENLITEIEELVKKPERELFSIFYWLGLEITCILCIAMADEIMKYVHSRFQIKLSLTLNKKILNKANHLSYANYEVSSFHNHLNRITNSDLGSRILSPFISMLDLLKLTITLYSMIAYLLAVHWSLLLVALLSSGPTFIVALKFGRKFFTLSVDQTAPQREARYIISLFINKQSAKEIRLFNLSDFLISKWSSLFLQVSKEKLKMTTKFEGIQLILQGLTLISYGISVIIMVFLISKVSLGIGVFVAAIQALRNTQNSLNQYASVIGRLFEDNLYLDDIRNFLNSKDKFCILSDSKKETKPSLGIEFINASFKYPQSDKYSLKDINLKVNPGEKIAIVGANGSGKSTLIKCLTGLYPLTQGEIYFDGKSIKNIDPGELHSKISVIFQDFIKYDFTVRENIGFGNINEIFNDEKLNNAAIKTKINTLINSFNKRYETRLGRQLYNGEDLSGGEWQRIAISRAFFSEADILVFDEPTSSLDPYTEIDIFNNIYKNSINKTIFFISHRMAATTIADKIIVMKNGIISEIGNHRELMSIKGEYYEMYTIQQNWFTNNSPENEKISV